MSAIGIDSFITLLLYYTHRHHWNLASDWRFDVVTSIYPPNTVYIFVVFFSSGSATIRIRMFCVLYAYNGRCVCDAIYPCRLSNPMTNRRTTRHGDANIVGQHNNKNIALVGLSGRTHTHKQNNPPTHIRWQHNANRAERPHKSLSS